MKRIIILLLTSLLLVSLKAQNRALKGIVTYQSSGSKPVKDVEIKTFGANPDFSDNAGFFELTFAQKEAGDVVRLMAFKKGYEIVNSRDLEEIVIRSDPDDLIRVAVCREGERAQHALEYYSIITSNIDRKFNSKLDDLNDKLQQLVGNEEESKIFRDNIKALKAERDALKKQAEELAQQLANTDLDQASEISKAAFKHFREGNIQEAIEAMNDEQMDQALDQALEERDKAEVRLFEAETAIRQSIDNYITKANFCKMAFQFEAAERNYLKAVNADSTDYYNVKTFANFLSGQNKHDQSIRFYQKALLLAFAEYQTRDVLAALGYAYYMKSDFPNALASLHNALDIAKKEHERNPYEKGEMDASMAYIFSSLASTYISMAEYKLAEEYLDKTNKYYQEKAAEYGDPLSQVKWANTLRDLGWFNNNRGNYSKALQYHRKALRIFEEAYKVDSIYLYEVVTAQLNIAISFNNLGRYEEAIVILLEALPNSRRLYSENANSYIIDYAYHYDIISDAFYQLQEYDKALIYNDSSLALWQSIEQRQPRENISNFSAQLSKKGNIYLKMIDYSSAVFWYAKADNVFQPYFEKDPNNAFGHYNYLKSNLAKGLVADKKVEQALEVYEEIIAAFQELRLPVSNPAKKSLRDCHYNVSKLHQDDGDLSKALNNLEKALQISQELAVDDPETYSSTVSYDLSRIAYINAQLQRFEVSIASHQKAIGIKEELAKEDPYTWERSLGNSYYDLGFVYLDAITYTAKKKYRQPAIEAFEKALAYYTNYEGDYQSRESREEAKNQLENLSDPTYFIYLKVMAETQPIENGMAMTALFKDHLAAQLEIVRILEKAVVKRPKNKYLRVELARTLGNLAWHQIFAQQYPAAEQSSRRGLSLDPSQIWINTNLALSLLLQADLEGAKQVYLTYKDQRYRDGRSFRQIFLEDLHYLENEGISHSDFENIRRLLRQ